MTWNSDHIGWRLLMNTRGLTASNAWFYIPGSMATNQVWLPLDGAQSNVFFRLIYP
jgi:hypothetical protein